MITHAQLIEYFGGKGKIDNEECLEVLLSLLNNDYSIRALKNDIYETLGIEPNGYTAPKFETGENDDE
jgi:hypothetical protein